METFINPSKETWSSICERPQIETATMDALVAEIFDAVENEGDQALLRFTERFDKVALKNLKVSTKELEEAEKAVAPALKEAIQLARENIYAFHKAQDLVAPVVETQKGVVCWQEKKAIEKVGLYIPGGTAPLFSTLLMLAVPAQIAGCEKIVLCTPCKADGKVDPAILYTAKLCGLSEIFKVGGIQAIAGLTLGTASIPKVYKLFGPGNQYVTAAKQFAQKYKTAIDLPAGPSELLVLADQTAEPEFVAADLLSQAEHGTDSQVLLVSLSQQLLKDVQVALNQQIELLERKEIAKASLANSRMIVLDELEEAMDLVNAYGPEHLIISLKNEEEALDLLVNAGSVFLGPMTPESAGDYASGTNHTLPTNGYAKNYSGVNLDSFRKAITYQRIDQAGLERIGPAIEEMAKAEGLDAHKNAVTLRLKAINERKEKSNGTV